MKKRLLSLLLAFSMMLTFLPVGALPAFAASGVGPGSDLGYDSVNHVFYNTSDNSRNLDSSNAQTQDHSQLKSSSGTGWTFTIRDGLVLNNGTFDLSPLGEVQNIDVRLGNNFDTDNYPVKLTGGTFVYANGSNYGSFEIAYNATVSSNTTISGNLYLANNGTIESGAFFSSSTNYYAGINNYGFDYQPSKNAHITGDVFFSKVATGNPEQPAGKIDGGIFVVKPVNSSSGTDYGEVTKTVYTITVGSGYITSINDYTVPADLFPLTTIYVVGDTYANVTLNDGISHEFNKTGDDSSKLTQDVTINSTTPIPSKTFTIPAGCVAKEGDSILTKQDGNKVSAPVNSKITISVDKPADGDAYEWTVGGVKASETGSSFIYTVENEDDVEIGLTVLKALKLTTDGDVDLNGVAYTTDENSQKTYTGNGWTYTEADKTLTITGAGTYDLTKTEPLNQNGETVSKLACNVVLGNGVKAKMNSDLDVTVSKGAEITGGTFGAENKSTGKVTNNGTISGSADSPVILNGNYSAKLENSGTIKNALIGVNAEGTNFTTTDGEISNCIFDRKGVASSEPTVHFTGTTVTNCVFAGMDTDLANTHVIREVNETPFKVSITDVNFDEYDYDFTFVGTPNITILYSWSSSGKITHINNYKVDANSISGISGTVTPNANGVTFTPDGTKDIVLNQKPAAGEFTFDENGENIAKDGKKHGAVTSTVYNDFEVKYTDSEGNVSTDKDGVSEVGDYTVTVTVNGETIEVGKFSIVPALAPAAPKAAAYYVKHYQEQLDHTYKLIESDTELLYDEIGKEVTATAKNYDNYALNTENSRIRGIVVRPTVDPDTKELDILTLELYYDLQSIPAGDVTAKNAAYRVEHYKEQANSNYEVVEDDTELLVGKIDETVEATAKNYAGYTLDTEKSVTSGTVFAPISNGEGVSPTILTLKLYYKMVKSPLTLNGAEIISVKDADGNKFDLDDIKNDDGSYNIPEGAIVTIEPANKAALADSGSVFDHWDITGGTLYQPTENEDDTPQTVDTKKEQLTFVMPSTTETVSIKLMTRDATIDEGPDLLGVAVITGTAVVGGAILAWQGYQLGTELYLKTVLPDWAVIPNNRLELAALLWRDAGQPAPESQTLYSDIDANDADAQNAARWVVENELISLPDADAPDTFQPYAHVSRVAVIKAWNKAQEMKH